MKRVLILFFFIIPCVVKAQTFSQKDSAQLLENVIINAYENNRRLIEVPAPISLVTRTDLDRNNPASIIESINQKPGVRMDERSPGSYRLSIRGSSLRSPFGVRNVKVYYNGIPYTDPGGNTYLNQLGFDNFQSVEIIKGPAGSLYGAGTGGVLLIRNEVGPFSPGASAACSMGSDNLNHINLQVRLGSEKAHQTIDYQHLTSDGYRDHTAMKRDVLTWDAVIKTAKNQQLQAHFLYGDLYYQTPGALTKNEYDLQARASRPAAGTTPSASQAMAAVYQKTFLAGFSYEATMSDHWKNTTSLYGAYSQMRNPNFRNYSRTSEPHLGGRTLFQYTRQVRKALLTFNGGAEIQQSFNTQRVYENKGGQTGLLQTDDEIFNHQAFIFLQANAVFPQGWILTGGASINQLGLDFTRLSADPPVSERRNFNNEITPRFALLKKMSKRIAVYGSVARGFSAPTTSEVLPSTDEFNTALQAESGIDYELGTRGSIFSNRLYFDVNAFFYHLKNAIIQQRDDSGADFFKNAGSAKQNGLESYLSYELVNNQSLFFNHIFCYASNTWNNFHYKVYKELDDNFSGNLLPGVASQTVAAGVDMDTRSGWYSNVTFFYSGRIALNDANTAYSDPYHLLGIRLGYHCQFSNKVRFEVFGGAANILNEKYSLGNDINAAGGRYYNAAPLRNYYAGVRLNFSKTKVAKLP